MAFPDTDPRPWRDAGAPRRSAIAASAFAARAAGVLAGLAATLATAATCGAPAPEDRDDAIAVRDGVGRTVTLAAPAERVVAMMPSVTEWVIAFGAADRLVARTDYDTQPALADLPSVGGGLTPAVEWLAARRPDLVFAWPDAPSRSLVTRLEALGITVYTAPSETIAEALDVAADVGRLLGLESTADSVLASIRARLDGVRAVAAGRPRPRVLFLIGLEPVMAAGPGTFLDELVSIAGGDNILAGSGSRWPQLSMEEVVARAPEVIIVGSVGVADAATALRGRPGWRDVPAVGAGRVHAVDPGRVNRPGPGLAESAALLARLIHGEAP